MATVEERLDRIEAVLRRVLPGRGREVQPLLTREQIDALDWLVEDRRKASS